MEHIKFLEKNQPQEDEAKNLLSRAMGRFYTHELIGKRLVHILLKTYQFNGYTKIKLVDPFCGDGRLICWLLEEINYYKIPNDCIWYIELWDCDEVALNKAKQNVTNLAKGINLEIIVETVLGDTFKYAQEHFGKFDIVVTNPPWEVIKPDRRELKKLSEESVAKYIAHLKHHDQLLTKLYPFSQPLRKFAGWGTNLARCGTEIALRLTASQGICGLVSPASLIADQVSSRLRHWIFREHSICDIAYYPAEAKLFDQVDQPSITLVASPGGGNECFSTTLNTFDKKGKKQTQTPFSINWHSLESTSFALPLQLGVNQMQLLFKLKHLPQFVDLEGENPNNLWAGRELDETRHQSFLGNTGEYLFTKGRMIKRFGLAETPSKFVKRDGPRIPQSANYYRIAWRDVSRPNQKRRIHATLIPPKWVTGNSLHVAYFRDHDLERLKALLAIMNSLVFEFQVRAYLATAHISLGGVRKVNIPSLDNCDLIIKLSKLTDESLDGNESSHIDLEIEVAKLYGLSQNEFELLLSSFKKIEKKEADLLLSSQVWS